MNSSIKYNIVIYSSLFIAFVCAMASCIAPTSAVHTSEHNESIKETEVAVVEQEKIEEPAELLNVDKKGIAQKYLDSIIDQIITDNNITFEMMSTWSTYSINKMTFKKQIMSNYFQYEVELKVTGENLLLPDNPNIIISKTEESTTIRVYMNLYNSSVRNGYLIKSIDIPSEI